MQTLQHVAESLQNFPVYITLDLDVLDPAFFPGTGTPEAGGVTFTELLQALFSLRTLALVGADLVELCPMCDKSDISTMTAIKLLRELILMLEE